jgi:hypothetical protein
LGFFDRKRNEIPKIKLQAGETIVRKVRASLKPVIKTIELTEISKKPKPKKTSFFRDEAW